LLKCRDQIPLTPGGLQPASVALITLAGGADNPFKALPGLRPAVKKGSNVVIG
jgi:hypothetical protein